MIPEKTFADAKFYDKLIAIFFTTDNCEECEKLFEKIKDMNIVKQKYYIFKFNAIEHLQYSVRLTRGIVPTISIVNPKGQLLAIIESTNTEYIEDKLEEIYYKRDKLKPLEYQEPKEVEEVNPVDFYDIINYVLDGNPVDFRAVEFLKFYSSIHKEYVKVLDIAKPVDPLAKYLLTSEKPQLDYTYTSNLAVSIILGIDEATKEELLKRIDEEGKVYRSNRKEVKGLLIDEALAGEALISLYQKTFDETYLNMAKKIAEYIDKTLSTSIGFRDSINEDLITSYIVYEPLANAEASIFFAKLWAIVNDTKYKENAKKAMNISYTLGDDIRVLSRIAISYVKLNELIKAKKPIQDLRVEVVKENGCPDEELRYKDNCYKDISEIKSEL